MKCRNLCALVAAGVLFTGGGWLPADMMTFTPVPAATAYAAVPLKHVYQGTTELKIDAIVNQSATQVGTDAEGHIVSPTIQGALDAIKAKHVDQATIVVLPGTYREKLVIRQPNLTMVGVTGPEYTTIVWDDAEGTAVRPDDKEAPSGRKLYGMSGCASIQIKDQALNFQAANITFSNDFVPEDHPEMKSRQALAMKNSSDGSSFWNCRFLGRQDTLLTAEGRQYFKNCYVEGDVDFIFGGADAVFEDCEIVMLGTREGDVKGFYTAPSTLAKDKGMLFYHCHLGATYQPGEAECYLGRPWHPSSAKGAVSCAAVFRECQIDDVLAEDGWTTMANKSGEADPAKERMFEYKNTGDGAKINKSRRQLSDADAANYTVAKYLDGWTPEEVSYK